MYELLDHFFDKANTEQVKAKKNDIHQQLVYLICSIVLDNTQLPKVAKEEQDRIDQSKFYYFGLIFKHFNYMEDQTKGLLLKQYFYKLIGGEKFKELSNKPLFGPLTKSEFKSGLKHPVKYEENPLLDLLKYTLQYAGKDEHDCLMEFIKILKSKAKLTNDLADLILRVSILNDDYNDIIKETFSTTFKAPNIQRLLKNSTKEGEQKSEISLLLCALLEQNRPTDESKSHSSGKRNTHSLIIKTLLELPMDKKDLFNECIDTFSIPILVDVLNDIIENSTIDTIEEIMDKYTMIMRSILIISGKGTVDPEIGNKPFLKIIYKLLKKGGWRSKIQWKGIKLFLKNCRDLVEVESLQGLPEEQMEELYEHLEIPRSQS